MGAPPDIARCYKILELSPGATDEELRKAYRDLVSVWHPDHISEKNPRLRQKAEQRLKEINVAYQVLREHGPLAEGEARAFREEGAVEPLRSHSRVRRRLVFLLFCVSGAAGLYGLFSLGARWIRIDTDYRVAREKLAISTNQSRQLLSRLKEKGSSTADHPLRGEKREVRGPDPSEEPGSGRQVMETSPIRVDSPSQSLEAERLESALAAIDGKIAEARRFLGSGNCTEAASGYRSALEAVQRYPSPGDPRLAQRKEAIEQGLAGGEIRYGARGYVRYKDQWFSPDAVRNYFVTYQGERRYYRDLKDPAERFADTAVRSHLRQRYALRVVHKKLVECSDLALLDNGPDQSRYRMDCRWEAWLFDGVETGNVEVLLEYEVASERWHLQRIREMTAGARGQHP